MLLAIDIGNSNVVCGIYDRGDWQHIWRLPTLLSENPLLYYQERLHHLLFEHRLWPANFEQVVISCVVPELRGTFQTLAEAFLKVSPITLGPRIYPNLDLKVLRPEQLGTDLYANAFAAHCLYQKDSIVVDFGTALSFTMVDAQGNLKGVNITPGLKTAIKALFINTAQLPEVPLKYPDSAVGQHTTHAIQSGVLVGYVGLVKYMVSAIREELGSHYQTVATGGLLHVLTPLQDFFDERRPTLTLDGLRLIGERY